MCKLKIELIPFLQEYSNHMDNNTSPWMNSLWQRVRRPSHPAVVRLYEKYLNDLIHNKSTEFLAEYRILTTELSKTPVPEDITLYINSKFISHALINNGKKGLIYECRETGRYVDNLPIPKTVGDFASAGEPWNNMWEYWTALNKAIEPFTFAYESYNKYIKDTRDTMEKDTLKRKLEQEVKDAENAKIELERKLAQEEWDSKQAERDADDARITSEIIQHKQTQYEQKIMDEALRRLAHEEYERKVQAKLDELRAMRT